MNIKHVKYKTVHKFVFKQVSYNRSDWAILCGAFCDYGETTNEEVTCIRCLNIMKLKGYNSEVT